MKDYKAAAASGGRVSAAEDKRILEKGMRMISEEFEGATSEKGLAKARNALATTRKAADKNWNFTDAADREAAKVLGAGFTGKGGKMAELEKQIRNTVRSDTYNPYG
jgi:hypothetical protein